MIIKLLLESINMWKALVLFAFVARFRNIAGDDLQIAENTNAPYESAPTDIATGADTSDGCGYPPVCGNNEVYNNCTYTGCTVRRCSELGFPLKCDKCKPGCVCKDGYVRADNGTCILTLHCPSCGGDKNAQQGCGSNCGRTCSTYNKPPIPCPLSCILNGCTCKPTFVYDNNIKGCVKPKDCTHICKANEQYSSCTNGGCDARKCSQLGRPVPCIKLDYRACIKGCICKTGYLRASNGTCVPKDQCAQYPPVCDKNEVYNNCTYTGCTVRRCSELGFPLKCDKCKPGCVCKDGYVRADNGTCILTLHCPSCGGDKNAQQGCGSNCGRTCSTYNKPPIPCPPSCIFNGCTCKPSFVYDNNIKGCVKPKDCTPICKANEQYSSCTNGGCDARNCSQLGRPVPCIKLDYRACIKGCICITGYLRASNGTCVPKDQCAPKCEKPNEVHDMCPAPCPPKRCNVKDAVFRCKAPPKPGDPECRPGCRCVDNYYRNATGICVPKKKCEKPLTCNGPNEIYSDCPGICPPQECGVNPAAILCMRNPEYGDPNCKPSCVCIDGYVRNDARECIPKDQCPKCTGENEYWEKCIKGCSNQTCDTIGKIYHCPLQKRCASGCRCKPGFYRDGKNVCIPESKCPKPCGNNEYWENCITGCSNQSCTEVGRPPRSCPGETVGQCDSGCRCNKGYCRDSKYDCIPINEPSSPKCPDGEVWSKCPTIKCKWDYCAKSKDSPQSCPVGIVCDKPRCVCGLNKKRDENTGKCIPITDCPKFKCGSNEEYQVCPRPCSGDRCIDYFNKPKCPVGRLGFPLICRPQCKCIKGHYRNASGVCIPACDCSNQTTAIETTTTPATPVDNTTSSERGTGLTGLLNGITDFTGKCLYNRMKSGPSENIAMSAMSVMAPIGILCMYSEDVAYDQCIKILNLKDKEDIRITFPTFALSYESQTSVNFSAVAKIYSNEKYQLNDDFKKEALDVFNAGAEELDFGKPDIAAQIINGWVASQTNNHIKDLVSKDTLNSLTRVVLVNAIYFKDDWMYQFNENNTNDEDFYLSDGTTTKTKMMSQLGNFKYADVPEFDCTALEMEYKGENFSMLFVLPNTVEGALPMAEKLQDSNNWNKIYGSLSNEKVQVYIPSFEINTSTDLKDLLQKVNMTKWFDSDGSGLTGILNTPENIYISDAIQKAFFKCDAKGSEATAANVFVGATTTAVGPPPRLPKLFRADHGFLFYILLKGIAIFSGHCRNP